MYELQGGSRPYLSLETLVSLTPLQKGILDRHAIEFASVLHVFGNIVADVITSYN